jgi:acetoin utilization deacetylase AcuC-like enzyme
VNGLFLGKVTNGFGDQDPAKALSDLYQVSNYYWGCKRALTEKIVCSPVAGFHHSTYNYAGKFCIFNGLLYAAVRLKEEGLINKVGIIDLDFHYGDGTDDIIHRLGIQYIRHWGFAKNWVPSGVLFLNNLKRALDSFNGCDIIMYQAGMDMFKDDPLGGLLTEDELVKRDLLVFEWAKANGKPICWNLAGGYTSPLTRLVALHNETMNCALKIYPGY